jgi:hypothetical protein
MAEWSIAAVLKTVDCNRSGGSNPSFSAHKNNHKQKSFKINPFKGFCFFVFVVIVHGCIKEADKKRTKINA